RRQSHPGHSPTLGPPCRTGLSPRLRPTVSHRWLSRVYDSLANPLWALGAPTTPADPRSSPEAALDAAAPAALCAGGQDRAAPAAGRRAAPRRVRHDRGRPAGPELTGLADQHGLRGEN